MAQTFLQIQNRILAMEGNEGATDTSLLAQLKADINEVYRELNLNYEMYWNILSGTVAASAGAAYITAPSTANSILFVMSPASVFLEPRDLGRQLIYADEIDARSAHGTYALRGVNATTGYYELALRPVAAAGNYTVWYTTNPVDLSANADQHKGPPNVADWLVWRTRYSRLLQDEERGNLIQQSQQRSEQILQSILKQNAKVTGRIFRGFPGR
jgi:hypothetical protein